MEVGAEVTVLPLELAETACTEAGVKWNAARKKRAGKRGKVAEVTENGAKITFEDEITDPETGAVVRTDTQTLAFPATALQPIDAAGEAAQAQMQDALASASAKVAAATAEVAKLQAEKDAATAALQAQVDALAKAEEKQKLKVQRLQKELATGMKAAETAGVSAASAEAERRAALNRAEAAESTVVVLERRVQMVVEAARGGKAAQHHGVLAVVLRELSCTACFFPLTGECIRVDICDAPLQTQGNNQVTRRLVHMPYSRQRWT
jgi:hypothetical protein|eukprot:COSAG02_NODE_6802_length_3352_cov_2.056871_3_plen_265_part_00